VLRERDILGDDAFRKNLETELYGDRRHFASRIQVKVEVDLGAGLDEAPGIRRKNISI
jgi:hypothetical protein